MAKIGLVDVDGHNFPNFALMKISAFHKNQGDHVEWADAMFGGDYDKVYMSKIFTFSPDYPFQFDCEVIKGGTGYDVRSRLPEEIEQNLAMDYSIYPDSNYSLQFFSRGCIRKCPFCLVRDKEGYIHPAEPVDLNPKGEWIEVLDNNFFANPEWKSAVDYLIQKAQPVKLHGVDIRIMTEEQAYWLNKMKLKGNTHRLGPSKHGPDTEAGRGNEIYKAVQIDLLRPDRLQLDEGTGPLQDRDTAKVRHRSIRPAIQRLREQTHADAIRERPGQMGQQ